MGKWNDEELKILYELYPNGEKEELCIKLNRKWKSISEFARKKGIYRNYQKNHTPWTEENIQFLKDNYADLDWQGLVEKIGTTAASIKTIACALGLNRNVYEWTKERNEILELHYPFDDENIIIELLENSSWAAICGHAGKLGIKRGYQWTDERIEILKECYYDSSWEEIYRKLDNNSKSSIQSQTRKLKLKRKRFYSEDDNDFLIDNHGKMSISEMAEELGRTENSITSRLGDLGMLVSNRPWANSDKEIMLNMLKELFNTLGRIPTTRELTKYNLPSPLSYKKYFDSYSHACDLVGINAVALFGYRCFSKNSDVCYSICEKIITDYLIDNNISYKKDILYSLYTNVKTRKTVDWVIGDSVFVEFFGLPNKSYYKKKMEEKRNICKENNIELIEIVYKDLNNLDNIFSRFV